MDFYFLSLLLLIIGGIVSIFAKEEHKMKICSVFSGLCALLLLKPALISLYTGQIFSFEFSLGIFQKITFAIDSLSAFFLLVISVMCFIATIYANGYIKPYLNKGLNTSSHSFFLMLLIASMLSLVTAQNALFFLIIWEIMSLSSFFLVIFEDNKKEVLNAGIKYLIYMHICVIFLILAYAIASIASNSFNFTDFINALNQNRHLANIVFLLSFIGFSTKAGFVPVHNWLPEAHPASLSHVSGMMSGVMIKTGIYGILRTLFIIGLPSKLIVYGILILSIISALWGVLYAISAHDIKKLLAYHSLENIGIIGIGISVGMLGMMWGNETVALLGFMGAILHVLNHSIFKMLLFFAAGSVYNKTHTKDVELLGGLIKKMPYTSVLFIIGSIAICALPPFNGFISEFLIYAGMVLGLFGGNIASFITMVVAISALALVGTMAILCFTKVVGISFLGNPRSEFSQNVNSDSEKVMLIPMGVLALFTLLIGLFPQFIATLTLTPVLNILHLNTVSAEVFSIFSLMALISISCFIFIIILFLIAGLRFVINKKTRQYSTWGCGYDKINPKMQYSASSYAGLLISTLKPLFKRVLHIKKPKDLFPQNAYYEVKIEDIEEAYIVKPLIKLDEKILAKFERIQNGNIQQYILFGLVFLILMIIGLIFIG
ncbi:MAG: hypothetical protein IJ877_01270 [Candidatus Gastranaerophilales bacterium]|nr:hypothetical protein [Candidatus Gastranaerophilales bacterium]